MAGVTGRWRAMVASSSSSSAMTIGGSGAPLTKACGATTSAAFGDASSPSDKAQEAAERKSAMAVGKMSHGSGHRGLYIGGTWPRRAMQGFKLALSPI
jgi:hypothetical protein